MNKRFALTLYLALAAALSAAVTFGMTLAGIPLWAAALSAYLLFLFLSASLAYRSLARRLKLEGQEIPPYRQYLFRLFRIEIGKFKEDAPRSTHRLIGVAAALAGLFFVFCGVALAFDAEWSRIPHPVIAATICLFLAGVGAAFICLARRLFAFRNLSNPPNTSTEGDEPRRASAPE